VLRIAVCQSFNKVLLDLIWNYGIVFFRCLLFIVYVSKVVWLLAVSSHALIDAGQLLVLQCLAVLILVVKLDLQLCIDCSLSVQWLTEARLLSLCSVYIHYDVCLAGCVHAMLGRLRPLVGSAVE